MGTTPVTGLPYIANQQNQPEVTHNDALNRLSMLTYGVIDRALNTPPGSPAQGDTYILGSSPTGAWAGRAESVAGYFGTGWVFFPGEDDDGDPIALGAAHEGLHVWVKDENLMYRWTGAAWANP